MAGFVLQAVWYRVERPLFGAMFAQAYEQLLARLGAAPVMGSAGQQLLALSRTIPGFESSPDVGCRLSQEPRKFSELACGYLGEGLISR